MNTNAANPFREWIRLEQPRLGSRVVFATDDFFAPKERLIDPAEPVFIADKYDDHGKWMDGWESRRKRDEGHDWCIVRLGMTGIVRGVDIDTSFFTGNFPPAASIDSCVCGDDMPGNDVEWRELAPRVDLGGDAHHFITVDDAGPVTHLKLNIYPDGGIARLRVYGEVCADREAIASAASLDLAAFDVGGRALHCSDEHYGSMHNLNVAGRGVNMGDGWETARRRTGGNDWVIVALGAPGTVTAVEIDTAHFKGNYPDRALIRAALVTDRTDIRAESERWPILLPESKLGPDRIHQFDSELADLGVVNHVRLDIIPDGGVSRLRIIGTPARSGNQ